MLLDSHIVWWLLYEPKKLGKSLVRKLERNSVAFFSSASVYELVTKGLSGKLDLPDDFVSQLSAAGLSEIAFTAEHAAQSRFISRQISDPFDRLLLAQAEFEQIDFYTQDAKILSLGLNFVKDAGL